MVKKMIDINNRYLPEEEIRRDVRPYYEYGQCVETIFNMNKIKGFCDLGCANGLLLRYLKQKYMGFWLGIEYFDWQRAAASEIVKNSILIHDLRIPLENDNRKYDIVNCTEVGEHIESEYTQVLIDNIKKLASKYVITTWSKDGGDPHGQHLNPMKYVDYRRLFIDNGFIFNLELTEKFLNESMKYKNFYFWWRESLIVWNI